MDGGVAGDGGATQLASGFVFAMDVRGNTVAYATLTDRTVYRMNTDGTAVQPLFTATTAVNSIAVGPSIYFVQPGSFPGNQAVLWQAGADGGATSVYSDYYGERVASDGTDVYWIDGNRTLIGKRTPAGTVTTKTVPIPNALTFEVDATHIYFAANDLSVAQAALWRLAKDFNSDAELVIGSQDVGGQGFYIGHVVTDDTKVYAAIGGAGGATGKILRKNKDGTGTAESVVGFIGMEFGSSVALNNDTLYYTDGFSGQVVAIPKTATNGSGLRVHEGQTTGLRSVVSNGYLYFYSGGPAGGVWRLPLP